MQTKSTIRGVFVTVARLEGCESPPGFGVAGAAMWASRKAAADFGSDGTLLWVIRGSNWL